jgi:hypothetical protein
MIWRRFNANSLFFLVKRVSLSSIFGGAVHKYIISPFSSICLEVGEILKEDYFWEGHYLDDGKDHPEPNGLNSTAK